MKKQTVGERFYQQTMQPGSAEGHTIHHFHKGTSMEQLQQIFNQISKAISLAKQAANQVQIAHPQEMQTQRVVQQLDSATLELQHLHEFFHESMLGLNASSRQQLKQLENELTQAEHTMNFLKSSLPTNSK